MRCPECNQNFKILESRIFDFTTTTFGCPIKGPWSGYTAKVYIDNVELVKCNCGVAPNVPHLDTLETMLSDDAKDVRIDPSSGAIYMCTWDDDEEGWILSQHQEQ
jgi:hypothetical protein